MIKSKVPDIFGKNSQFVVHSAKSVLPISTKQSRYLVKHVTLVAREGRQPHRMASGPQFPLKIVFAALHFTRMSSVPHQFSCFLGLPVVKITKK